MGKNKPEVQFSSIKDLESYIREASIPYTLLLNRVKTPTYRGFLKKTIKQLNTLHSLIHLYETKIILSTNAISEIGELLKSFSQLVIRNQKSNMMAIENQIIAVAVYISNTFEPHKIGNYFCVVPSCCEPAISSHTISRANNFLKGTIYHTLNKERSFKNGNNIPPEKLKLLAPTKAISNKKASTYKIFCGKHDRDIFLPIENGNSIDMEDEKHLYLQNWRTFTSHHLQTKDSKTEFMLKLKSNPRLFSKIKRINIPDYMESIDGKAFRGEEKVKWLTLNIPLEQPPMMVCACIIDANYIGEKIQIPTQKFSYQENYYFYINILNNGNNPVVNISAIDNHFNRRVMKHFKEMYLQDKIMFWNKVMFCISTSNNIYFQQGFFDLFKKTKSYLQICKEARTNNKNFFDRPNYHRDIELFNSANIPQIFGKNILKTDLTSNF